MTLSSDEALDLLRKWSSEASPIICSIEFAGGIVFGAGRLMLNSSGFVIAHHPEFKLAIAFSRVLGYHYADLREANQEARERLEGQVGGILILLLNGSEIQLYEGIPGTHK
jgi:hypothetical protein